jgi:hypothetical protein
MRFMVSYKYTAEASEIVEADSLESAEAMIEKKVERDDFDPGADSIDDVQSYIQPMHPVTRDGREVWATYVRPGDVRGHQSALATSPLFSGVMEQEAAPVGAVGTR